MKAAQAVDIQRRPRRLGAFFVPEPVTGADGLFLVDATWGHINPMRLAPGVRTIGELEVIAHIEHGQPLVDSRLTHQFATGTIPTAVNIPHTETTARIDEFDAFRETVIFCNGPQCGATPDAVEQLVTAGYPADAILYYRGGIHDWLTLGLPVVK